MTPGEKYPWYEEPVYVGVLVFIIIPMILGALL